MKILSAARNIVNTEEIEQWLTATFAERFPALTLWCSTVVRKWIIKNAPAVNADIGDTTGMPAWLRDAMTRSAEPAQNVVLGDELRLRIQQVLDYMDGLLSERPDTNISAIGFDVAEQRAAKWHARMANQQRTVQPESENGTEIIIAYPDGWSWRKIIGEDAMIREGELMGHCVGRFNYYHQVLRARTSIVSLRDAENKPHVTIEISEPRQAVQQIKGRANQEVVARYLPRVADYLKSRTWKSISFDGARALTREINEHQMFTSKPVFESHGYRVVYSLLTPSYESTHEYARVVFVKDQDIIGSCVFADGSYIRNVSSINNDLNLPADCCAMLREFCDKHALRTDSFTSHFLLDGTEWTNNAVGWCEPKNAAAQMFCRILGHTTHVLLKNDAVIGWVVNETMTLTKVSQDDAKAYGLSCPADIKHVAKVADWLDAETPDAGLATWLQKQRAGKSIQTDGDDVALLNSLLAALKQPDAATVKAGYLRLKNESVINDQKLKALGFSTSGRSINAIAAVLLCSLPLKNSKPFREYVFSKPNTLNCWQEVVSTPDHLAVALRSYGLDDVKTHKVVMLLRNEFLRLSPSESEIKELDLDAGVVMRVRKAMQYAETHRQDAHRSKQLWSAL